MATSDDIIAHAGELLRRMSPEARRQAQRRRERRRRQAAKVARRILVAAFLILAIVTAWAFVVGPIGQGGVMLAVLAFALSIVGIGAVSREPDLSTAMPTQTTEVAALPARTEDWLDRQRAALPAPAQRPLDAITLQLEALAPQLATIDPREPVALEARRLLADELPELVKNYQKVPQSLRRAERNGGPSPDRQLVDGLGVIGEEIARMNERLATGDLNALATQQRYLELKYKGDDADPA